MISRRLPLRLVVAVLALCVSPSLRAQTWVLVGVETTDSDNSASMPNNAMTAAASDGAISITQRQVVGGNVFDRQATFTFSGIPGVVASAGTVDVALSGTSSGGGGYSFGATVSSGRRDRTGFGGSTPVGGLALSQTNRADSGTFTVSFPAANPFEAFYLIRVQAAGALTVYVYERQAGPPAVPSPRLYSITPDEVAQFSPTFLLQASGSGFSSEAVVLWNERELETRFIDSLRLEAIVPAILLDIGDRFARIRVVNKDNSDPALRTSNTRNLFIRAFAGGPDVTIDSIEVVQATQEPGNTIPLIQGKATMARVFVRSSASMSVRLRLYGSLKANGGTSLPGSPMEQGGVRARPGVGRTGDQKDGEFLLPESWTRHAQIFLRAEVIEAGGRPLGLDGDSLPIAASFQPSPELTIGYLPVPRELPSGDILDPPAVSDFTAVMAELFPIAAPVRFVPLRVAFTWRQDMDDDDLNRQLESISTFTAQNGATVPNSNRLQLVAVVHPSIILDKDPKAAAYANTIWNSTAATGTTIVAHGQSNRQQMALTIAHELGHNMGLRHPATPDSCGTVARDGTDWPHMDALIQEFGVRPDPFEVFPPDRTYSLMSYCDLAGFKIWISPFSYRKLISGRLEPGRLSEEPVPELGPPTRRQLLRRYMVVGGSINRDASQAAFDAPFLVQAATRPGVINADGEYCLEAFSGGASVYRNCFDPPFASFENGIPRSTDSFLGYVPHESPVDRVELTRSGVVLNALTSGPNPPVVTITAPAAGTQWTGERQTIQWTGSDADGDDLRYAVTYSADGGRSWLPLALNLQANSLSVDAGVLSPGSLIFRVEASGGLRFGEAQVGPVVLTQSPSAEVGAGQIDFGPQPVGQPTTRSVTISNAGTGYLDIASASVDNPAFEIVAPAIPVDVRMGDSTVLTTRFVPQEATSYNGTLTLTTNDAARPAVLIPLAGSGAGEGLSLLRTLGSEIAFGAVAVGESARASIVLENSGTASIRVLAGIEGSGFALELGGESFGIDGAERRALAVLFAPSAPGVRIGRLILEVEGSTQPPIEIALAGSGATTVGPGERPSITAGGVVNAASFGSAVSPGSWVSIFGQRFASGPAVWDDAIVGDQLPTTLAGVQVLIDGKPAAVAFLNEGQINAQAPDTDARGSVSVEVVRDGVAGDSSSVTMGGAAPAWFTYGPGARRYAAAVHPDGIFVGPSDLFGGAPPTRPAAPGDRILVFGTGFGPTDPPVPAGRLFKSAAPLSTPVTVLVGNRPAAVEFAGLSGAGLNQFNLVVPSDLRSGDQRLLALLGSEQTDGSVYLTIGSDAPAAIDVRLVSAAERVRAGAFLSYSWTSSFQDTSPKNLLVEYLLSRDQVRDGSDLVLELEAKTTEQGQSGLGGTGSVRVPAVTAAGDYFFAVAVSLQGSAGASVSNWLPVTVE